MLSQRMSTVYEKFYHAVCNQRNNQLVAVANEIFDKPVLFVDQYFHVVSMAPTTRIGNSEWDEIVRTKAMNHAHVTRILDEFLSGKKAFYDPFYANSGSCRKSPKLFSEVVQNNQVHGHIIIFWDRTPPTEEDYHIVELLNNAICLRLSSRIRSLGTWNLALSTKLENLLTPGMPTHLQQLACEAISETMQPEYTICVTTIGELASQRAFSEYAVRELQQLYRNVICTIYDNNIVTLYGGSEPHGSGTPRPRDSMADKLFSFFGMHDMVCGISDSFTDPSAVRSHYRQALLTARLAIKLGYDKSTSFSDLMPLPIFLSVLEKDSPDTFIHPAIFKMQAYDKENGTAYTETMRAYSFSMHSKDYAASALCIHRNTLQYRLGRINELFGLAYEDEKVAQNLLCSFLILELERIGAPEDLGKISSTENISTEHAQIDPEDV